MQQHKRIIIVSQLVCIVTGMLMHGLVIAGSDTGDDGANSHYALLQQVEQERQSLLAKQQDVGQSLSETKAPLPKAQSTYPQTSIKQEKAVNRSETDKAVATLSTVNPVNMGAAQAGTAMQTQPSSPSPLTAKQKREAAQRDAAFEAILKKTLPMTPSQIARLRRMYDKTQEAAAKGPKIPPLPTSTSQVVDLSPGAVPPVIRLSQGFVSSLVFVDSTGAPWPITAYDLGNPKVFNIQWDKNNTLMIQALSPYTYGNLAVKLQGQTTPVMLTLIPGQKVVDYRVDLRVSGLGPNAKFSHDQINALPLGANPVLLHVLDGVPPSGSQTIKVTGGDAQAWGFADKLYIRTRYNVLSPAWVSKMSSADGTNAYEMPLVPVLLVERNGKTTQLRLGRYVSGQ